MPQNQTHTVSLRIDPNLWERFQRACKEDGTNASAQIRDLVTEHVAGRHEDIGALSRRLSRVQ